PVHPEADEAVPRAEIVARPQIHPAGARILFHERGDGDGERDGEQQRRQYPQGDGAGAGVRRGRKPSRADDARDREERNIAEPEFTPQFQEAAPAVALDLMAASSTPILRSPSLRNSSR